MSKILITGAAGYIGTVLLEILSNIDTEDLLGIEKIYAYDNLCYKQDGIFPLLKNPKIEFIYGDVRDYNKLQKYIDKSDVIIPLAALVGPCCEKDKRLSDEVNHLQIKYIAGNCSYKTKIILPNSNSGYGKGIDGKPVTEKSPLNPLSTYGVTKCAGEKALLDSKNGIVLRLATVFGTSYKFRRDLLVNDFVLRALRDKFIVLFEAHFKRNYIHVRDVCVTIIRAIEEYDKFNGEIFNVGLSSANLSKLELCEKIKEYIPDFVIKTDDFTKDPDKRDYIVSNSKLEENLWIPQYSLDEGIKELISAYPVLIHSGLTQYTNL